MKLQLKLEYSEDTFKNGNRCPKDEKTLQREQEILEIIDDGEWCDAKITTNKKNIELDRKDERNIKALKNIKMIFGLEEGGCIILRGNLKVDFSSRPYGGGFYVTSALIDESSKYEGTTGVEVEIRFNDNRPTEPNTMFSYLESISSDPDFEYNFSQFDEFMEVFEFYKSLSNEINNNTTYNVLSIENEGYFAPVDIKADEAIDQSNPVYNENGILTGYFISEYDYEMLQESTREQIIATFDIEIKGNKNDINKIRRFFDNVYLTEEEKIDENNSRNLRPIEIVNITLENDSIIITADTYDKKGEYLHLYDMGQKIKIRSIEDSLRLINQAGSSGSSVLLQYLIGDKKIPKSSKKEVGAKRKYMQGLDESQKKAFLMATDQDAQISLIKGPPGTGKTHVINAVVQYITKELGEKVVISSQTHVAIDNVLDKLMENYDLIIPNRITNRRNKYSTGEIDRTLFKTWATKFENHNKRSRRKTIAKEVLNDMASFEGQERFIFSENTLDSEYSVIGATTTTSAIGGKRGLELLEGYDWLIIDEVSKCPITEVLRYLPYVNHIIMVGDDYQLAPLLEIKEEEVRHLDAYDEDKFQMLKKIYEESVFAKTMKKAEEAERLVVLSENYRSVKNVLETYNVFYDGTLNNLREKVKPSKVEFDDAIPAFNETDVFFVDVKNAQETKEGHSRKNVEEIEATVSIIKDLMKHAKNKKQMSVAAIFLYAAQISLFQKQNKDLINQAKQEFESFEIDTVDAFQGKEADIVLVNTVVTDQTQGNFLNDFRRINVSMSRARDKLFIFGNPTTLSKIEMKITGGEKRKYFADIIKNIKKKGKMIEYDRGVNYATESKTKIAVTKAKNKN